MVQKFGGINLSSKDVPRLLHFYRDLLGVPVLEPGMENDDGVTLGFQKDAPCIWLWDENRWGREYEGNVNLVFEAEDLDALYRRLREQGVPCDPPYTAVWGGKECKLHDPDGNVLTIL